MSNEQWTMSTKQYAITNEHGTTNNESWANL